MYRDRRSHDAGNSYSNSYKVPAFGEDIPTSVFCYGNSYKTAAFGENTFASPESPFPHQPYESSSYNVPHNSQHNQSSYFYNQPYNTFPTETQPLNQSRHIPIAEHTMHQDDRVVASEHDETKLKKKIVRLEKISGILSIACLITSFYFAADEGFNKYVRLTRSVIIYSRKPENNFALKTWVTQYNNYCPSHPQHLLEPAWETLNKESYDGVGSTQSVFASKLYIWPLAFTVFVFSAFFQFHADFGTNSISIQQRVLTTVDGLNI